MSIESDQGKLDTEFERLRVVSGRIARDPGGVGMDVESLPDFFNNVAHLWDAKFAADCAPLHRATAMRITPTDRSLRILDVGCGTGLEIEYILERAPNAQITALDLAPRMLAELERKYAAQMNQIETIEASCVDWPAGLEGFDYVISILCVHHFPPETKRGTAASNPPSRPTVPTSKAISAPGLLPTRRRHRRSSSSKTGSPSYRAARTANRTTTSHSRSRPTNGSSGKRASSGSMVRGSSMTT